MKIERNNTLVAVVYIITRQRDVLYIPYAFTSRQKIVSGIV